MNFFFYHCYPTPYPRSVTVFFFKFVFLYFIFLFYFLYFILYFYSRAKITLRAKVSSCKSVSSCIFDFSSNSVFVHIWPVPIESYVILNVSRVIRQFIKNKLNSLWIARQLFWSLRHNLTLLNCLCSLVYALRLLLNWNLIVFCLVIILIELISRKFHYFKAENEYQTYLVGFLWSLKSCYLNFFVRITYLHCTLYKLYHYKNENFKLKVEL